MKALVTGGAGFIGGHIARDLVRRKFEVTIVDNLHTGDLKNIPKKAKFYNMNICSDEISFLFEEDFKLIYHFAGQSSVELSYKDPIYDLRTNTESTLRLLNGFQNKNCHFIYASSMSVYGGKLPMPKNETCLREGCNFYAVGKKTSEDYLRIFSNNSINTTSLRLFNIYGPGQNLNNLSQGMLSIYLAQAIKNKKILVKGSLDRSRDFVHIYDVLRFLRKIEDNKRSFGEEINICSGKEVTVKEVIDSIKKNFKEEISIEINPGTPGDINRMVGDPKKLKKITEIDTSIGIDFGVSTMLKSLEEGTYYE